MTQITSEVLLVSDLFTKGKFEVPWHQRYYDWTTQQVGELITDLTEAIEEGRASYFLGSIMLVESKDVWQINDGQQRLITLSLLIASLCRRFAARRQTDSGRELLALRLLFDRPATAVTNLSDTPKEKPRIKPPRQDKTRFTQIICGHNIGTNGKLTSAWNEIEIFITGLTQNASRRFFEFLTTKVEIGVLYVPKMEDANAVFEALNGRGKQLDDVDLIRNHLYSYFSNPSDEERLAKVHDQLESVLQNNRTQQRSQDYFRCYFQCKYGYLQKNRFYRETRLMIRQDIKRRKPGDYVYELVTHFSDRRLVELFRTITASNPNQEFLSAFLRASSTTKNKRNLPVFLSELVSYKVVQPLLFTLLRKFIEAQGSPLKTRQAIARATHHSISDLASFVVRITFSEAKFEPSRFEAAFANIAKQISAMEDPRKVDLKQYLRTCDERRIMDNTRFISQITDIEMKDPKRAKRFLFGVNADLDREARALDFDGCSVEHVLPQSEIYWKGWTGFSDMESDIGNWVHRIGNQTLLGGSDHFARNQFNTSFEAKRKIFNESPFVITRNMTSINDWTPDAIRKRSKKLARIASRVWAFSV